MRRTRAFLTITCCIFVLSGDAARALPQDSTSPFGSVYQAADAVWIRKEAKGTFMYFAVGLHHTNLTKQRTKTMAFIDRTRCAVAKTEDIQVTVCAGSARGKKVPPERFGFDPLMSEATLRFQGNRVKWRAEDLPEPWAFPAADPSWGAIAFASVDRWANASGTVLGRRFKKTKWSDWGNLSQGGYAGVINGGPNARIWFDETGDQIHYRFRSEQQI